MISALCSCPLPRKPVGARECPSRLGRLTTLLVHRRRTLGQSKHVLIKNNCKREMAYQKE